MIHLPRRLALLAGVLALGAGIVAQAADAPPAPELVSGASASMLAETCAGCHGTDGASAGPASPILGGGSQEYFVEVMKGFRDGKVYSTIMGRIAKGYTDDEFELMADYFVKQPFKAAQQSFDEKLVKKGSKLHDKYCEKCHSEGGSVLAAGEAKKENDKDEAADEDEDDEGKSSGEDYYILAGQWTPYLVFTMQDFRADRREMPKKMKGKLKDLIAKEGEDGLKALFAFYASKQ
jgi:cytochrome subunit of sulfide dehydrogenase